MATVRPVIVPPCAGDEQVVIGDRQFVRLRTASTGGALMLLEQRNDVGAGVPTHVHLDEDEIFHVLDGQVDYTVEGMTHSAVAGATVYLPRGVAHSFVTRQPSHVLVLLAPPSSEAMFGELAALPPGPPEMERVMEICTRHRVLFEGASGFDETKPTGKASVLGEGEGPSHDVLGIKTIVKAAGGRGGACSLFELQAPPGSGVPPHRHELEDETFVILEGRVELTAGGRTTMATAGTVAFLPRNQVHSFQVVGNDAARFLVAATPGGSEAMFAELAALEQGTPNLELVTAICGRHSVFFA